MAPYPWFGRSEYRSTRKPRKFDDIVGHSVIGLHYSSHDVHAIVGTAEEGTAGGPVLTAGQPGKGVSDPGC